MNKIFLSLVLLFAGLSFADESELASHKLTGTVVSNDKRYKSAAILDDKIWWIGQTYLVVDGKIQFPVKEGGRVEVDSEDLATLTDVRNSEITVEYRGKTYTFAAR